MHDVSAKDEEAEMTTGMMDRVAPLSPRTSGMEAVTKSAICSQMWHRRLLFLEQIASG